MLKQDDRRKFVLQFLIKNIYQHQWRSHRHISVRQLSNRKLMNKESKGNNVCKWGGYTDKKLNRQKVKNIFWFWFPYVQNAEYLLSHRLNIQKREKGLEVSCREKNFWFGPADLNNINRRIKFLCYFYYGDVAIPLWVSLTLCRRFSIAANVSFCQAWIFW